MKIAVSNPLNFRHLELQHRLGLKKSQSRDESLKKTYNYTMSNI